MEVWILNLKHYIMKLKHKIWTRVYLFQAGAETSTVKDIEFDCPEKLGIAGQTEFLLSWSAKMAVQVIEPARGSQ